MIFEKDLLSLSILDVLYLDQKNVSMMNAGRNFDAISFRIQRSLISRQRVLMHTSETHLLQLLQALRNN